MDTLFVRRLTRLNCFVLALFAAWIGLSSVSTQAAEPDLVEGKWYGTVGFPEDRVEIGFEIKRNEKQELVLSLFQPVMNFYGLQVPGILKKEGDTFVNDDYRLSVKLVDGKLEGTYFPFKAPISLQRTKQLPAETPVPDFPKGPGPRWRAKLGSALYAPAAVRDGVVYLGTGGGYFHALSLTDGSFRWTFSAGRPIHGEALTTADHVFFVCDNGFLFKLDRRTGKEVWRYDLGDAQATRILTHQVVDNGGEFDFDLSAPKPLLWEGVLYVGSGDGSLHAVNATDGKRIWRFEGKGKIRTDAVTDGTRLFVGSWDGLVFGVDRASGKELWRKETYGPVTGPPQLIENKLMVGNRNGLLAALEPATGKTLWRMLFWGSAVESSPVPAGDGLFYIGSSDLRRVSLIDSKDGRVLWRTDVYGWSWPRPLVTEKYVIAGAIGVEPYVIRHFGSLSALDRKTGKIAWRWPMPEWPGSFTNGFAATPVVEGKTIVVGGLDGTLYAFPLE
ncbi:MAG: PQQ-binding-like beta-propeller repeat protein [Blastocatellia bacterium]|nr:PQQ-binding-like beta-propeller repeat protein [Blastocatellia bacterium]